ncbi:asialoglycoprotein receptor 2-like [Hoplias malabaricus]|uniref:asialoglycoprotein receptor 2-like n=1 Tax=Hoplias malabaricus TaxID=27720 RepID=UPI003462A4D5
MRTDLERNERRDVEAAGAAVMLSVVQHAASVPSCAAAGGLSDHDKENEIKKLEAEKQKLCEKSMGDDCCARGWKYFSGKCYYFPTDKKTWTASRDACVAAGGDLVIVSSTELQDFVNRRILPFITGYHYYWVGLTDAVKEGDWRWIDGTPLSTTSRMWSSDQPDNWKGERGEHPEGEDCAAMALRSTSYFLFDKFCDDRFNRVCEAKTQIK